MVFYPRSHGERRPNTQWMYLENPKIQFRLFLGAVIGSYLQFFYNCQNEVKVFDHPDRILDYVNYSNSLDNMNWGQRKLLEAYNNTMVDEESLFPNPYCYKKLTNFGDAVGEYDKCILDMQKTPSRICLNCHPKYAKTIQTFKELSRVLKKPIGPYVSCAQMFMNNNQINVYAKEVERIYSIHGVWAVANCRFCFEHDDVLTGRVKEEVERFMLHSNNVHSCFGGNYGRALNGTYFAVESRTRCNDCHPHLQTMHSYYNSIWGVTRINKSLLACTDVLDKLNMTINIWNEEIRCNIDWRPHTSLSYPSVLIGAILMYIVFSILVIIHNKWISCQRPSLTLRINSNQVNEPNLNNVQLEHEMDEAMAAIEHIEGDASIPPEVVEIDNDENEGKELSIASSGALRRKNAKLNQKSKNKNKHD